MRRNFQLGPFQQYALMVLVKYFGVEEVGLGKIFKYTITCLRDYRRDLN